MASEHNYLEENELAILKIKKEYLSKLEKLKKESDRLSEEYKTLLSAICEEISHTTTETTHFGEYNYVVKGGFYSTEFDLERFKEEHLNLYIEYLKPSYSKPSASLVKVSKGEK